VVRHWRLRAIMQVRVLSEKPAQSPQTLANTISAPLAMCVVLPVILCGASFTHPDAFTRWGGGGVSTAAVVEFTTVLEKAPRDWKLSQAALGGRNQSRRALGEGGEDGRNQWLWGRGVRFPGTLPAPSVLLRQRLGCATLYGTRPAPSIGGRVHSGPLDSRCTVRPQVATDTAHGRSPCKRLLLHCANVFAGG
jgi:hypothetical protein